MGDGLYSSVGDNEGKGVFPHATYINLLKLAMQEKGHLFKIGIVTAPFKGDKLRAPDRAYTSLSEMIVTDLIDAIKREFRQAEVRLHNSPESSIIESLARIVQARKVAICGCSTFCPLLAREKLGFMYNPAGGQNIWVRNAAMWHSEFRLFDTPMLNGLVISNNKNGYVMPKERVLNWLRKQDPTVGNIDIVHGPIFRSKTTEVVQHQSEEEIKPFVFDQKSVQGKSFENAEGLYEDGTYLLLHDEFHQGPSGTCAPFVEQKDSIKRVHYHFTYCKGFGELATEAFLFTICFNS
jgi:hypothetical protein